MDEFYVEVATEETPKNMFEISSMNTGYQLVKKGDQILHKFGYSGRPCHKFFRRGSDVMIFIGSSFCGNKYIINLTQNIVYESCGYDVMKEPLWIDIHPNSTGEFFVAIESYGDLSFYDLRNMECQPNKSPWKFIRWSNPNDYPDVDLTTYEGNVEFTWIDSIPEPTFYFKKPNEYDVKIKMNEDLTFTVVEYTKFT